MTYNHSHVTWDVIYLDLTQHISKRDTVIVVIVWYLDVQLPVQSVPNVVISSPTHAWFSPGTPVSSTNKADHIYIYN